MDAGKDVLIAGFGGRVACVMARKRLGQRNEGIESRGIREKRTRVSTVPFELLSLPSEPQKIRNRRSVGRRWERRTDARFRADGRGLGVKGQRRRQVLGAGWWDAEEMRMWTQDEEMCDDGKVPLSQTSGMIALGQTKWK